MVLHAETSGGVLEDISLRIPFHDHGHRTRVSLRQGPFGIDEKRATTDGWLESFERIDSIVAARASAS